MAIRYLLFQKPSYPANMEGTLMKFDQKEFFDSSGGFLSSYSGLEDVGYLYVPKSCKDGNKGFCLYCYKKNVEKFVFCSVF